ncbi:MAG: T9SS type A sorting domain-containing protein [Bacteroidia bacterium]|nr:T9SS type A sorting domain-containing protein [Bacteroidia bacterium]
MKFICVLFSIISYSLYSQSLNSPEGVVYEPISNRYLVSNAGTGTSGGSIVAYNPATQSLSDFIPTGVNSPKGMCIINDTLFVTDVTSVRGFNVTTGTNVFNVDVPASNFLHDITNDNQNLYLSDNGANKIFVVKRSTQESYVLASSPFITSPEGLYYDIDSSRLILVSFIANSPVQAINPVTGIVSTVRTTSINQMDGLTMDNDGNYYASSWNTNNVVKFDHNFLNAPVEIANSFSGPGDIYFNPYRMEIAVPNFINNTLDFISIVNNIASISNPYSIKLFPNPTNADFSLSYTLKSPATVKIELLDKNGKHISSLKDDQEKRSEYKLEYNAKSLNLSKGVYFIKISIDDELFMKSLVITG